MRMIEPARRLAATVAVAASLLALGAGGATAANVQVDIAPAGATTASGTITLTTGSHAVACAVTADVTFAARSTGATSAFGGNPAVNAQIGSLDALSSSSCSPSGATIELQTTLPAPIHHVSSAGGRHFVYISRPTYRMIDPAASIDCTLSQSELRGSLLEGLNSTLGVDWGGSVPSRTGSCDPGYLTVAGTLALAADQTVTVTTLP